MTANSNELPAINTQQLLKQFDDWLSQQEVDHSKHALFHTHIENFTTWFNLLSPSDKQFTDSLFKRYRENIMKRKPSIQAANETIEAIKLFGRFLLALNVTTEDPTQHITTVDPDEEITEKPQESILTDFERSLTADNLSSKTIKNYISDCEQFFAWYHQYQNGIVSKTITNNTIGSYRKYLQFQMNMAPASIDRKVSALKKFFTWAEENGIFSFNPFDGSDEPASSGVNKLIGVPGLNKPKRAIYVNRTTFAIFSAAIIVLLLMSIFRPWELLFSSKQQDAEQYPIIADQSTKDSGIGDIFPWIIEFKGQLKDKGGLPIEDETKVTFSLYETETSSEPLWQSSERIITPSATGQFVARLGDPESDDEVIDTQLYFGKETLYISIFTDGAEQLPRTQISTAQNAVNSVRVSGYEVSATPGREQIPVINRFGEIAFATDSAKIKTTGGTIGLEGEAVTISTPYTSTENITLAALGGGNVNIISNSINENTLDLHNAQLSVGALIGGTVQNDNKTADLINLRAGSTPTSRFRVDVDGNIGATGNLTILNSITGLTELYFSDSRVSYLPLSELGVTNLPGGNSSVLGAINENYKAASAAAKWVDEGDYVRPRNITDYVRVYGNSGTESDNYLEFQDELISAYSGTLTIDAASTLILDTENIDLSSNNISIDLIDSNDSALVFESGLLTLDTANTSIDIAGDVNLGDGGNTDYINIDPTGNMFFYGAAYTITGSPTNGLTIDGGTSQSLTLTGDLSVVLSTPTIAIESGTVDTTAQSTNISIIDDTSSSLYISQGLDSYFAIDTNNSSEAITFGNTNTNPAYSFLGSGTLTISGDLTVEGGDIVGAGVSLDLGEDIASTMTVSGNIYPTADNSYSLGGSGSARWSSLYVGPSSLHVQCTTGDGCSQNLDYAWGVETTTDEFQLSINSSNYLSITNTGNIELEADTDTSITHIRSTTGDGNNLTIQGSHGLIPTASAGNDGGDVSVISGNATDGSDSTNGEQGGTGGDLYLTSGNGGNTGVASGTASNDPGDGGRIYISAGDGGVATTQSVNNKDADGGDVIIEGGAKGGSWAGTGTPKDGDIYLAPSVGYVGVRISTSSAPAYPLDITGDVNTSTGYRASGSCVAGICSSDIRLKKDIQPISSALKKIMQVNPVSYQFIDPHYGAGTQYGFIAQEIEQVFPELVTTGEDGYKKVNYGLEMQIYTIQAVKELQQNLQTVAESHSIPPIDSYGDIYIYPDYATSNIEKLSYNQLASIQYKVTDAAGKIVNNVASFKSIITGDINAAFIKTRNLFADTFITRQAKVTEKFISPVILTNHIQADSIELAGTDLDTQINKLNTKIASNSQQIEQNLQQQQSTLANIIAQNASNSAYPEKITADSGHFDHLLTLGASDSATAYLNVSGNASVSGQLIASSARFKILEAEKIKANDIEGLDKIVQQLLAGADINYPITNPSTPNQTDQNIVTTSNQDQTDIQTNTGDTIDTNTSIPDLYQLAQALNIPQNATDSSSWAISPDLAYDTTLSNLFIDAETGLFNTFLSVLGTASIVNLDVTNTMTVDRSMHITNNSISVIGDQDNQLTDTLYLQKHGLGSVDILAGAVIIKDNGDLYVDGDIYLAGNLYSEQGIYSKLLDTQNLRSQTATIGGQLYADHLTSTKDNIALNLNQQISTNSAQPRSRLKILSQNNEVASIDASGSATFNKLIIASAQTAIPSSTTIEDNIITNASAGTATIQALHKDITITNPNITPNSLIYITPTSNTQNNVLYISKKIAESDKTKGEITISINALIGHDITFNWWIIN